MKKVLATILCVIAISALFSTNVKADIGPKPSVVIDISGLEGQHYYVTLLSSTESTGPYSASNPYQEYLGNYDMFAKFSQYDDIDGYYFLGFFEDCFETNRFSWTYFPPQKFKLLIYLPETDTFIASYIMERYAFDSYFKAVVVEHEGDLSAQVSIELSKTYDYKGEVGSLVIRILLTIGIELAIAWFSDLRGKKVFFFIAVTNIITQILLNLALNFVNFHAGMDALIIFYILLEVVVFAFEAILYVKCLDTQVSKQKLVLYALSSNLTSFGFGMLLALWLPSIF
jgi:hypothetical protein